MVEPDVDGLSNGENSSGHSNGQIAIVHEHLDAIENVVGLLDTAVDVVKVQSQKLCSALPMQKLRRLVSVPYTLVSDYVVGEHVSLVRAAADVLPVAANGRVCVHYALLNTAPRYESNVDSSTLADVNEMLEEADGPEPGIAHRCEYYGCPKCPTVSPSSEVRPKSSYQTTTSISDSCVQSESEKQRLLALENELQALKEQLMQITKTRECDKQMDNARGSPPPEPSTSSFIPTAPPPPPPPPPPVPLAPPRLSIAHNAKNLDVDSVDVHPPQTNLVPSMMDILKDISAAKDKLKPVPFTKSPGGTPFRRRRSGGNSNSRFSGQHMDHGTLIAEALRKKFAGINGDQSPQRVSECRGDDEWNSSFDDTPTDTPWEEGDGQKVSVTRVSRRTSMSTPQRMQGNGEE